jgi:hypothetical protein
MIKTFYTLHGLEKNSIYFIRVKTENENGAGPFSDPLVLQTWPDLPSQPPNEIEVEPLTHNSILTKWKPPPLETHNGDLTGYKIRYKSKTIDGFGNRNPMYLVVNGSTTLSRTIEGLRPGTKYSVRIAAMNKVPFYIVNAFENS